MSNYSSRIGIVYNIVTQQDDAPNAGITYNIVKVLAETLSYEFIKYLQVAIQALQEVQVSVLQLIQY